MAVSYWVVAPSQIVLINHEHDGQSEWSKLEFGAETS